MSLYPRVAQVFRMVIVATIFGIYANTIAICAVSVAQVKALPKPRRLLRRGIPVSTIMFWRLVVPWSDLALSRKQPVCLQCWS